VHPEDLKYGQTHEWIRVEENLATIGITDHAQSELGDIVFVELPEAGATLQKGTVFGSIESVKTVSDLVAPVSGEVVEVNEEVPEAPELLNENPYSSGWLVIVKVDDPSELDDLMDAQEYERFIQEH
jgi:glycine cleavage system H protein